MIKQDGKSFTITKTVDLSAKQKHRLQSLTKEDREAYILSIAGLQKSRIKIQKPESYNTDLLKNKPRHSVLRRFENLLDNGSGTMHRPATKSETSRWVGVEIECLIEGEDGGSSCDYCDGSGSRTCGTCEGDGEVTARDRSGNEYEVSCSDCGGDGYSDCDECDGSSSSNEDRGAIFERIRSKLYHQKVTRCSVKSDGSLHMDGHTGVEVTLLFDMSQGFAPLQKVCKVLNDMGAKINGTCGLHVHIDVRNLSRVERVTLGKKFGGFLPALSQLVPHSRRNNSFCKLAVSPLLGDSRYYAVNMTSVERHGTIEIRLHSGTTSFEKISNWVLLLQKIKDFRRASVVIQDFQALIWLLKLEGDLLAYFDKRHSKFNVVLDDHETSGSDDEQLSLDDIERLSDLQNGITQDLESVAV